MFSLAVSRLNKLWPIGNAFHFGGLREITVFLSEYKSKLTPVSFCRAP